MKLDNKRKVVCKKVFEDVKGFPAYQVNRKGQIFSKKKKRLLNPYIDNRGYYNVELMKDKKRFHFQLHRLLAHQFIPNPEDKPCIDHINRDKTDNNLANLRWVTYQENNCNRSPSENKFLPQFISYYHDKKTNKMYYRFKIWRQNFKIMRSFNVDNYGLDDVLEYRTHVLYDNNIEIMD